VKSTDRTRKALALYRKAAGTDNPAERDAFLAKARDIDVEPVDEPIDDVLAGLAGFFNAEPRTNDHERPQERRLRQRRESWRRYTAKVAPDPEFKARRAAYMREYRARSSAPEAPEPVVEPEASYAAALAAERKETRAVARTRAAWIKNNPDAIAWLCADCGAEYTDDGADQGQGPLYECGDCGTRFTRDGSADGDSNRCPDCNRFGAKAADLACSECGEGELEVVGPGDI